LKRYKILNAVTNGSEAKSSGSAQQKALHRRVAEGEATIHDPTDDVGFVAAEVKKIPSNRGLTNSAIDPIKCANVDPKITLLWGTAPDDFGWSADALKNQNNHSVVVRVEFGSASLLITGDLEKEAIASLLDHYRQSTLLTADVYQVGHHGSHNATSEPLLDAIAPKIAVIAMGPFDREESWTAWKYGHPRKVTVDLLEERVSHKRDATTVKVATGVSAFIDKRITSAIYATGWDGTVVLEADTAGAWNNIKSRARPAPAVAQINVNTANVAELSTLPRIGPARAQAIVHYRTEKGAFRSVDELEKVSGIGPATFVGIRELVRVQ
jgi:comEA protein